MEEEKGEQEEGRERGGGRTGRKEEGGQIGKIKGEEEGKEKKKKEEEAAAVVIILKCYFAIRSHQKRLHFPTSLVPKSLS